MKFTIPFLILSVLLFFSPTPTYAATQYSIQLVAASTQYATGADYADATVALTMCAWFKTNGGTNDQIINKKDSGGVGYSMYLNGNKLQAYVEQGAAYLGRLSTADVNTNVWFHACYVWNNSAETLLLYVNGSSDTGTVDNGPDVTDPNTTQQIRIGADRVPTATAMWNGGIDDVRIWTRALSASEVTDLYTNPCTFSNGASLEAWWNFNNDYLDESGNGRTLTGVNTPTFSTVDVPYTTCAAASSVDESANFMTFE